MCISLREKRDFSLHISQRREGKAGEAGAKVRHRFSWPVRTAAQVVAEERKRQRPQEEEAMTRRRQIWSLGKRNT